MCVDLRMTLMLRMKIIALIVEAGHLSHTQSPIGLAFLANQFPLGRGGCISTWNYRQVGVVSGYLLAFWETQIPEPELKC